MTTMLMQGRFNIHNRHSRLRIQKIVPQVKRDCEMEKQGTQRRGRLVLVPPPLLGHMAAMLQLGSVLHSKGFSITVIHTKLNSPDPRNHPDFAFQTFSGKLTKEEIAKGVTLLEIIDDISKTEFQERLARMMEVEESNDRVLGVIHDLVMHFPEAIASNLKLPSFHFMSSNASYMHAYQTLHQIHEQGFIPVPDSKLEELVPEHYPLRFKDLPILDNFAELALQSSANASDTKSTTSGLIWNTIDFLEHASLLKLQKDYQVPVFPIGPLHKFGSAGSTGFIKEDQNCLKWLDMQAPNSVIYASLGSVAKMDKKELVETACGLAISGQPFLWVVRPGSVHGSEEYWFAHLSEGVIEQILERGCIVTWAPQKKVLAHKAVGGFWSHCGWNSCLESMSEGVPMICRPLIADQKVNSRYLTYEWKVGIELEAVLERGKIASAIRTLLVENEGEEIRERAIEMKEKIRACIQEGGSSYKSLNDLAEFFPSCFAKMSGVDTSSG